MSILDRDDLILALIGIIIFGVLFFGLWPYVSGIIEYYIGAKFTGWVFFMVSIVYACMVFNVIEGWWFVRKREREKREEEEHDKRLDAKLQHEEQRQAAEWEAFTNWVKQNPATAERLMCIVEYEQIDDPERRAWIAERRETEGPNVLTDLPRLFDWLKAQRDLRKFGLGVDLPGNENDRVVVNWWQKEL